MTPDEFWELIDHVDREALEDEDEDAAVEPLVERLTELEVPAIEQFAEQLGAALYQLDARKYADAAGQSGQSSDGFLYARCYVVGCGRQRYEQTLADPARMPKNDEWFESLLYAAEEAWSQVTGREPEEWDYVTQVSYETGSNQAGWA